MFHLALSNRLWLEIVINIDRLSNKYYLKFCVLGNNFNIISHL